MLMIRKKSFNDMKKALKENDFEKIGEIMEYNTMFMHKTMQTSNPPFTYLTDESIECIEYIKNLRTKGYRIYFTTDAGPNVKVLFFSGMLLSIASSQFLLFP